MSHSSDPLSGSYRTSEQMLAQKEKELEKIIENTGDKIDKIYQEEKRQIEQFAQQQQHGQQIDRQFLEQEKQRCEQSLQLQQQSFKRMREEENEKYQLEEKQAQELLETIKKKNQEEIQKKLKEFENKRLTLLNSAPQESSFLVQTVNPHSHHDLNRFSETITSTPQSTYKSGLFYQGSSSNHASLVKPTHGATRGAIERILNDQDK